MTEEHKRMLRRHGRITCMDATYKVVQWGLPLFLMVVVDEHGASIPAAYFMVSEESNTAIDEVLGYIKSFVPEWDPRVFMMDKSAAEMLAVRTRFPNAIIILCEFHVKQAWLRSLVSSKRGLKKEEQHRVYNYLNKILKANSQSMAQVQVQALCDFIENYKGGKLDHIWTWFADNWLPCLPQWCSAYWAHVFTQGFTTNNYTETLNKVLKSMLCLRADLRCDSMLRVLLDVFDRAIMQRHIRVNLKSTDPTKSLVHPEQISPEFSDRPPKVMQGLEARKVAASKLSDRQVSQDAVNPDKFYFLKNKTTMKNEFQFVQGIFSDELGGPRPGSRLAQRDKSRRSAGGPGGRHATGGGDEEQETTNEGQGADEGGQGADGDAGEDGADVEAGVGAAQHDEDAALCEEVKPLPEEEVRIGQFSSQLSFTVALNTLNTHPIILSHSVHRVRYPKSETPQLCR